jgi:hypothetical protein
VAGLPAGPKPIAGFLVAGRRVAVVESAVAGGESQDAFGGESPVAGGRDAPGAYRGWHDAGAPLLSAEQIWAAGTVPPPSIVLRTTGAVRLQPEGRTLRVVEDLPGEEILWLLSSEGKLTLTLAVNFSY